MTSTPPHPGPGDRGDREASFAAQAQRLYGADLYFFLLSRLKNEQDAKDVVQEIYLRLLRLGEGELVRDPHAYVYFVASQVLAQFRMRAKQSPVMYDSKLLRNYERHPADAGPDATAERWLALAEVEELLAALPPLHRKVFILRKLEGLSWAQIAARLQISAHTVKKYLCEANARINLSAKERESPHV